MLNKTFLNEQLPQIINIIKLPRQVSLAKMVCRVFHNNGLDHTGHVSWDCIQRDSHRSPF